MGILSALSRARAAGISWGMARRASRTLFLLGALALAASACDVRPLTASELYGAGGRAPVDGGGGTGGPADSSADAPPPGCLPQTCATDQYCDELTGQCASRTGAGMLSGIVVDTCTGLAVDAAVGLAGRRMCAHAGKGSYFFTDLPLGKLKLSAFAPGYVLYDVTVDIVPGGVIHDIRLTRAGGCDEPLSPIGCSCSAIDCIP